jgi:hypothetical protein
VPPSDLFDHFDAPTVDAGQLPRTLDDRYALRSVIGRGGMAIVMIAAFRRDLERALGQLPGKPQGAPRHVEPDVYSPTTELGQDVLAALTKQYL